MQLQEVFYLYFDIRDWIARANTFPGSNQKFPKFLDLPKFLTELIRLPRVWRFLSIYHIDFSQLVTPLDLKSKSS